MPVPEVMELSRTCLACPSQWRGKLDDGRDLYIRYRNGYLTCGAGRTFDDAVWPTDENTGEILYSRVVGDYLDGYMTEDEMFEHLTGVIVSQDT